MLIFDSSLALHKTCDFIGDSLEQNIFGQRNGPTKLNQGGRHEEEGFLGKEMDCRSELG